MFTLWALKSMSCQSETSKFKGNCKLSFLIKITIEYSKPNSQLTTC